MQREYSRACKVKPKDTMAEIVEVEALSAHRIRLSVKPLEGGLPMFLPGQYVNVTALNEMAKRPYSFTSAPGADVATSARIPKFSYETSCSGPGSQHPLSGHFTA